MGDSRRFHLFAKLVEKHLDKELNIVDVASGKGHLQAALRELGFKNIVSWDKRKKNASNRRGGYRYGYFDYRCSEDYDAVVALHPDEGTDHAILYCGLHQIPGIICPCCIKPHAVQFFGRYDFSGWSDHLKRLAGKHNLSVQETVLPMNGRNFVMILKPGKIR